MRKDSKSCWDIDEEDLLRNLNSLAVSLESSCRLISKIKLEKDLKDRFEEWSDICRNRFEGVNSECIQTSSSALICILSKLSSRNRILIMLGELLSKTPSKFSFCG
jgi:hypothetical protein